MEKDSLTNIEKKVLNNIDIYLKNMHLKNLKKHFKNLQKYEYGLDYLFNEPTRQNNGINAIKEVRMLLNKRRSNLLLKETKRIRKELYKKVADYNLVKRARRWFNK